MSDRLAHFGRRAKKLIQGSDTSSDPSASAWQPRDPSARPSSLTHLGGGASTDQPDAVEETVLNEELPLKPSDDAEEGGGASAQGQQKRSAFPQAKGRTGRAISAAPGRARTRGEGNAGWNVRTLETSPKRATTQLKDTVKDKVKGILQRKGSAESSDSNASSEHDADGNDGMPAKTSKHSLTNAKDPASSALDKIASADENPIPSSLRGSDSLGSNPNGSRSGLASSSWSSSGLVSGGSTLSYLARPALQALAALDEPDSTADLTLPWSGSMNIGGGASGTSSYASLRARQRELDRQDGEKEAVDIQLLASAALSGCSVVMAESDGPWVWSGVMAEVSDLLRMEPQVQAQQQGGGDGGRNGKDGKAAVAPGNDIGGMATGGGGTRSRGLVVAR